MSQANNSGANLGFERDLWQAADALRSNMDAAEYKHVVLGLIFLKYISDAFEEYHARLEAERVKGADPEDPDEYRAVNIFWVPMEARWSHLLANAKQPTIGKTVDDALVAIERDNPSLKDVLPKDYAHARLDKQWGDKDCEAGYEHVAGFRKAATLDDIRQHGHILTPGRCVGAPEVEDDGEPPDERMECLTAQLEEQFAESARLEAVIWQNLDWLRETAGD